MDDSTDTAEGSDRNQWAGMSANLSEVRLKRMEGPSLSNGRGGSVRMALRSLAGVQEGPADCMNIPKNIPLTSKDATNGAPGIATNGAIGR